MIPDTAILVSNFNRRDFLKNTLDSLYKTIPKGTTVLVVDDASTDNPREILKDYPDLIFHQFEENKGLRAVVSWGIDFLTQLPMIKYITYMENDVFLKEGWLEECKKLWVKEMPEKIGLITCHNSPEHPCPEEKLIRESCMIPKENAPDLYVILKPTERSTHLFASVERWKKFGKIPTERPKESGGSQIDWWLMGHPTKYEQSEHSLRRENEWVAVIPGYCYHMGNISSTYGGKLNPEFDEFVNLIYPYQDMRRDICFQFNPSENKEFWNIPNKKVGAIMLAHNDENYIMQCLLSIQNLVDKIVIVLHDSKDRTKELIVEFKHLKNSPEVDIFEWSMPDNISVLGWSTFNLADKINEGMKLLRDMDWVLHLEPDLILYEQENPDILRKASAYLELRGFNCMNLFMRDFVYDYGHINAVDYGEGAGNFYSERRFFKNENVSFKNPAHTCPSNVKDVQEVKRSYYRFWNEWQGMVAKTRYISMAHYGLTRGIERIRMRTYFKSQKPFIFWDDKGFKKPEKVYDDIHQENTLYEWPIMQYRGRHPMYMGVD